ncbi:MAG TPA: hypothetical protein VFM90_05030, partial [Cyclobacteriaceae bacterium]|nr:hypothetical protein [Cyclobacteriaceae bacterium]
CTVLLNIFIAQFKQILVGDRILLVEYSYHGKRFFNRENLNKVAEVKNASAGPVQAPLCTNVKRIAARGCEIFQ